MPDADTGTMLAIERIRRVIAQYGQLMDDGRFAEWSDLFTEDAEFWSIPGHHLPGGAEIAKIVGRAAIVASVRDVNQRMAAAGGVIHFGGNPVIDIDGETARAWWDFMVLHVKPAGTEIAFAGRYHTDLRRDGARWRFHRRVSLRPGYPLPAGIAPTPGD